MSQWSGELRLMGVDADRVVFYTTPDDDIKLTVGRRYAVAIVELDDNDQLAPDVPERETVKRATRQPSNQAAILAKNERFQIYAARRMKDRGDANLPATEETATEFIRRFCEISSRADLDTNRLALDKFHEIELEYYREISPSQ